ncbi:MAG: pseudouridine synthase [Terriglobia bacterium]
MAERLQKLIARAGLVSRRTAESWILSGRVRVNGRVVTTLGSKADPACDRVEVDDTVLRFSRTHAYLMLHKPRGTVTTAADTQGRPTILDLLRRVPQRVFPVGRLPYEAEGLLLLTSDGAFADALLRAHLPQTFWLKVKGHLSQKEQAKLARVARRRGERTFSWKQVKPGPNPWYEAVLRAPRQDWLRAWLFRLGHPVEKLKRVAIGRLALGNLPVASVRALSETERRRLLKETDHSRRGR